MNQLNAKAINTSARFWDKIAHKYSSQPISDPQSYQKKLEISRTYLTPETTALEFGCGTGSTALLHAPFVKQIHAIDISSNMIEIARGKADKENIKNVHFEQAAIDSLPAPSQPYDVVFGLSILHLLEDKDAVIKNVFDQLKPGGTFISNTACLGDSYFRFIKYIAPIGRFFGLLPLVKVFSEKQLIENLLAAGFEIEHQWRPENAMTVFVVATKPSL